MLADESVMELVATGMSMEEAVQEAKNILELRKKQKIKNDRKYNNRRCRDGRPWRFGTRNNKG